MTYLERIFFGKTVQLSRVTQGEKKHFCSVKSHHDDKVILDGFVKGKS